MNPISFLTPEIIIILLVVIILPIFAYLIYRWVKKYRESKADKELMGTTTQDEAYHPKIKPKKNETRIGLGYKEVANILMNIKNSIGFVSDDMITIVSNLRKSRTKYDLANIENSLQENYKINIRDVLSKGLTPSQIGEFSKWENKLPTYISK